METYSQYKDIKNANDLSHCITATKSKSSSKEYLLNNLAGPLYHGNLEKGVVKVTIDDPTVYPTHEEKIFIRDYVINYKGEESHIAGLVENVDIVGSREGYITFPYGDDIGVWDSTMNDTTINLSIKSKKSKKGKVSIDFSFHHNYELDCENVVCKLSVLKSQSAFIELHESHFRAESHFTAFAIRVVFDFTNCYMGYSKIIEQDEWHSSQELVAEMVSAVDQRDYRKIILLVKEYEYDLNTIVSTIDMSVGYKRDQLDTAEITIVAYAALKNDFLAMLTFLYLGVDLNHYTQKNILPVLSATLRSDDEYGNTRKAWLFITLLQFGAPYNNKFKVQANEKALNVTLMQSIAGKRANWTLFFLMKVFLEEILNVDILEKDDLFVITKCEYDPETNMIIPQNVEAVIAAVYETDKKFLKGIREDAKISGTRDYWYFVKDGKALLHIPEEENGNEANRKEGKEVSVELAELSVTFPKAKDIFERVLPYSKEMENHTSSVFSLDKLDGAKNKRVQNNTNTNQIVFWESNHNMVDWSFASGNKGGGPDWNISIPDGYSLIESSQQGCSFELIPATYLSSGDSPTIFQGCFAKEPIEIKNFLPHHPIARLGVAEYLGLSLAYEAYKMNSRFMNIYTTEFRGMYAFILSEQHQEGYVYEGHVVYGKHVLSFVLNVFGLTKEQKLTLDDSIKNWLSTFSPTKLSSLRPTENALHKENVIRDLGNGQYKSLQKAIDEVEKEYNLSKIGLITQKFYQLNGLYQNEIDENTKCALENSIKLKEYYLMKADELLERLQDEQLDRSLIINVIDQLEQFLSNITLKDGGVTIKETDHIKEIKKKWKSKRIELKKLSKAEEAAKKENILANYKNALTSWEDECKAIDVKRQKHLEEKIKTMKIDLAEKAKKSQERTMKKAQTDLERAKETKNNAEATLSKLGLFKFNEKKVQKALLEEAIAKMTDAKKRMETSQFTYENALRNIDKKVKANNKSFKKMAMDELPYPEKPIKPSL